MDGVYPDGQYKNQQPPLPQSNPQRSATQRSAGSSRSSPQESLRRASSVGSNRVSAHDVQMSGINETETDEHIYLPQIDPNNPSYDPSYPTPEGYDPAYPGWVHKAALPPTTHAFSTPTPPEYDLAPEAAPVPPETAGGAEEGPKGPVTDRGLPPYLGVVALISLALFTPTLIAAFLIGLRIYLLGSDNKALGEDIKQQIKDTCMGVAAGYDAVQALPALMKASSVAQAERAANASVSGLAKALILILEATKWILYFLIITYASFYQCIAQLVVFGSVALGMSAVTEITDGLNSILPALGNGVSSDAEAFANGVNTVIGGINTVLGGAQQAGSVATAAGSAITGGAVDAGNKITSAFGKLGGIFGRGDVLALEPSAERFSAIIEATPSRNILSMATATALPRAVADWTPSALTQAAVPTSAAGLVRRADSISIATISLPNMDALKNVSIPTDFYSSMTKMNDSIPNLSSIYAYISSVIEIPIGMGQKAVNETGLGTRFNSSRVLANANANVKSSSTMCSDIDYSSIDDLLKEIIKWTYIVVGGVMAGILLFWAGTAFLKWWQWRKTRILIAEARNDWNQDHPGQPMNVTAMLSLMHYLAAPVLFQAVVRIPGLQKNPAKDSARWYIAWLTHPYSLALLAFAIVGIILYTLMILVLTQIIIPKYGNDAALSSLFQSLSGNVFQSMKLQSKAFADSVNQELTRIETAINKDIFVPIDNALISVNTTLNHMIDFLDNVVDDVFGNTLLKDSGTTFVNCIITNSLRNAVKGITWLEEELQVNMTKVDDDEIMPSNATLDAMSSGNGTNSDYLSQICNSYVKSLEKDRLLYFYVLLVWILVAIGGLVYCIWATKRDFVPDTFEGEPEEPIPLLTQQQGPYSASQYPDDKAISRRSDSFVGEKDPYAAKHRDYESKDDLYAARGYNESQEHLEPEPPKQSSFEAPYPAEKKATPLDTKMRDSLGTMYAQSTRPEETYNDRRGW